MEIVWSIIAFIVVASLTISFFITVNRIDIILNLLKEQNDTLKQIAEGLSKKD
jgi:hypothetical protein